MAMPVRLAVMNRQGAVRRGGGKAPVMGSLPAEFYLRFTRLTQGLERDLIFFNALEKFA
jgi:hypothetical protein